jgi:hypothetical protein
MTMIYLLLLKMFNLKANSKPVTNAIKMHVITYNNWGMYSPHPPPPVSACLVGFLYDFYCVPIYYKA